jgi:hypothetical protein
MHGPDIESELALAIFRALKNGDPTAFIQGEPDSKRTIVDGTFNLEAVAKMILWDLKDHVKGSYIGKAE